MAPDARKNQPSKKKPTRTPPKKSSLPFTKENYVLFFAGLFTILIGYIAMASGERDGFLSLTLSPILLVIGYLVLIPLAILYRKKEPEVQNIN